MKAHVVSKVDINAKPEAVFKYIVDLRYHQLWNPHLKRISPIMILETGKTYRATNLLFGLSISGKVQVHKIVEHKELIIESITGMLQFRVMYRLKPKAGGTQLSCTTNVSSHSKAFAFAEPMAALLAGRELRADLGLLKIAVEQNLD